MRTTDEAHARFFPLDKTEGEACSTKIFLLNSP